MQPEQKFHSIIDISYQPNLQLQTSKDTKPENMVIVNPILSVRQREEQKCSAAQVHVFPCALSYQHKSPAQLNLFNLPSATSLHQPEGILQLYPNLQIRKQTPVEVITLAELLATTPAKPQKPSLLILQSAGEEIPALDDLFQGDYKDSFTQIKIRCGHTPLYQTSATVNTLKEHLTKHGYTLKTEMYTDPDQPLLTFERNELLLEKQQLKFANETLAAEKQQQAELIERYKQKLETYENDLSEMQAKSDTLQAKNQQLKSANETLAAEKQQQAELIERYKQELETHKNDLSEMQAKSDTLQVENSALTKQQKALQERQNLLEGELLKAEAQIELIKELYFTGKQDEVNR
ncbi:hypothetical protein [Desulfurispira natronophila]|uniref:FtsZ-binding cell division protein ZapB n=1 Tax=Desulfurispira natronophila TaxID=682562 RepID=A0A7W7Y6D4_9BACT|nr:hypothetical protein [Desulfurispira natronophila]MBB5022837.1 FtsZ-binding cell division protein ZapB [Desulfurispira natronophila]